MPLLLVADIYRHEGPATCTVNDPAMSFGGSSEMQIVFEERYSLNYSD